MSLLTREQIDFSSADRLIDDDDQLTGIRDRADLMDPSVSPTNIRSSFSLEASVPCRRAHLSSSIGRAAKAIAVTLVEAGTRKHTSVYRSTSPRTAETLKRREEKADIEKLHNKT